MDAVKPRKISSDRIAIRTPAAGLVLVLLAGLASCSSAPRYRTVPRDVPVADPAHTDRVDVVDYARSFIGTPYRTGGSTRQGMDCSGLVSTVYKRFHIDLPRRSIDQSRVGEPIARARIQPGDLVFFKTSGRNPVTHVGIYLGDGSFIHASTSARQVRVDHLESDYFSDRFVTARRVLDG